MKGFRWFFCACVELSNRPFLSKQLKAFATSSLSKPFVPLFVKTFNINIEEAQYPLKQYSNLHSFFIRELKENRRTIHAHSDSVISPVDGILAEQGNLSADSSFVVKGQRYSIQDMLGSDTSASLYEGGQYQVLYLSPSHYHRFHAPLSGAIQKRWTLGARSYPVNHWGMTYGKKPLSGNYRVISEFATAYGAMAMVKVGAMNINTIELTHQTDKLEKGDEVGYFSFGSTVVLIWSKDMVTLNDSESPKEVQMGEAIGRVNVHKSA
ncbi:phosphatidylserine decarboxylase [Alkalicoccobacillus murimartini]|uniref:Phosphatidylserine decarboxylase proenzyme n=1 Tax=Alkalicoccobacillus murimartini TaxID=171685 RepID=A0ABT9YCB8_9BACI|nr:phosphatidylserine decarboxylase [Alkalicoccobacillus murimartini]MDQ0205493.1 phosphatidylserine decarboxylase [Alkalicoccobacillus murimartini]